MEYISFKLSISVKFIIVFVVPLLHLTGHLVTRFLVILTVVLLSLSLPSILHDKGRAYKQDISQQKVMATLIEKTVKVCQ